jgi:hypothetical protein
MDSLLEHDADILRPPWGWLGRDATLGLVSSGAKVLLRLLNTLRVDPDGLARYRRLTMDREPGVGLLTYCNHTRSGRGGGAAPRQCSAGAPAAGPPRPPAPALSACSARPPLTARPLARPCPTARAHSTFDDPGLPSALLPWWMFWLDHEHDKMRWTMCASDVCFKSSLLRWGPPQLAARPTGAAARLRVGRGRRRGGAAPGAARALLTQRPRPCHRAALPSLSQFFGNGKTLSVERGSSVHQPVLGTAARIVGTGGWLHVFPEGKVQPAGDVGAFRQVRGRGREWGARGGRRGTPAAQAARPQAQRPHALAHGPRLRAPCCPTRASASSCATRAQCRGATPWCCPTSTGGAPGQQGGAG